MILAAVVVLLVSVGIAHSSVLLILSVRDRIYQQKWNKEKAMRMRANPKISRAELCEYFVMFCLRNNCKVHF